MFFLAFPFLLVVGALISIYAYFVIRRLLSFYLKKKNHILTVINVILAVAVGAACCMFTSTASIVLLHVVAAFALCDLIAVIIRRISKKIKKDTTSFYRIAVKIYRLGVVPILIAAMVVGYGFYNMAHPVKTQYTLTSQKISQDYTVAFVSDTHFGTVQSPEVLQKAADEISELKPDVLILGGDIIEDSTSNEDMKRAFEILGDVKTTYGVYYIYGNHDKQNYSRNKNYTSQELIGAITSNGIKILPDETVEIGKDLVLVGRNDSGFGMGQTVRRKPIDDILAEVEKDKFILVADHRPTDIESYRNSNVDLVMCGHTHAGQIFPVGAVQSIFGVRVFGEYNIENCKMIISSGFAGWKYPIRTEKHSEYVVVNIQRAK